MTKKQIGVYIGRRITIKGKLAYFWNFEGEEKARGYKDVIAPAVIGEAWEFTFEDGTIFLRGEKGPGRVPSKDGDSDMVKFWGAQDIASYQSFQDEKEMERLKKRKQPFDKAMEPLVQMYETLRTSQERNAFMNAIRVKLLTRG